MIRKGLSCVLPVLLVAAALAETPGARIKAEAAAPQVAAEAPLALDDIIREALEKNPAIQSAYYGVEALRRRVPQARSLPDPTLSVGWMGSIRPFTVQRDDPSSYRSVGAMQTLPYPGKRALRGEIASKEADAAQWDYEAVRRRITADVKAAYYDYFFYDRALQVTARNQDLLTKLSQISEARYRVGKGIQQDVLKSQVEISLLLQRQTTLEQQRALAQARLNSLMGRSPESALGAPADIQAAGLSYTLNQLYGLARQRDPQVNREQQMVARNQLAVNLAQKDFRPDLSIGYMYQQRPAMPDMHGLTFSVNLPVFYKSKQREAVGEATEQALSAERSRDSRINELYFELKEQYLAAKASEQLLALYSQAVVPQSSLALESSMSAYQTGAADFITVLGNFSNVLDYETNYYRELANYQTALARMEALVGEDLTSLPPLPAPVKK
jgi:outer membrane protein TolC